MTSNPPKVLLSEIVTIKGGKRLPAGKSLQSLPSEHPYIRVRDVGQRNLPREGIEYVPDDVFPSISRYIVQENDVVLSIVGTIGALSIVDNFYDYASLTENCVKLTGLDYHDALYLYYYLSSGVGQQEIFQGTVGAVQPKLPIYNIEKIKVLWPYDKDKRKYIASVLGKLDDKIDLNRRINQTLEAMAQAIFQSWFVDFDPVKAKIAAIEQGQDPLRAAMRAISGKTDFELDQMPRAHRDPLATTAALFPDAMEESELGEIPKGWEVSDLGSVSVCFDKNRIPLSKRQRENRKGNVPYYGATSVMDYVDEHIFDGVFLLLGEDGSVLKEDGTPFVQYIWGKSWVNNHAHVLQGSNGVSTEQLMIFISMQNISAYVTGAVQLKLNQKNMNSIPFVKASNEVNCRFSEVIAPVFAQHRLLVDGIRDLADLRDTLLPKLLSGELRVPDAERIMEKV